MSSSTTAYLVVRRDDGFGDVFPLTPGQSCGLGRASTNRIVLKDDLCSREHAEVSSSDSRWRVRDLGSLNGTFVNDRNIGHREKGTRPWETVPADLDGVELHAGDRLAVGSSEFLIDIQNSAPECDPDACVGLLGKDGPTRAGASSGQS